MEKPLLILSAQNGRRQLGICCRQAMELLKVIFINMDCNFHYQWCKGKRRSRLLPGKRKRRYLLRNNLCWGKTRLRKIKALLWLALPNKHRGSAGPGWGSQTSLGKRRLMGSRISSGQPRKPLKHQEWHKSASGCSWDYLPASALLWLHNSLFVSCVTCWLLQRNVSSHFPFHSDFIMEKVKDFTSLTMSFYGEWFYSPILFSPVVCFRCVTTIYRKQQRVTTSQHILKVCSSWKGTRGKFYMGEWITE